MRRGIDKVRGLMRRGIREGVEPLRGRSFIWKIGVNSSIQDRRQVD